MTLRRKHQRFQTLDALSVARSVLGGFVAAESKELAIDDDVDVLREAFDQLPALRHSE
jgi:hypothetical protein